MTAQTHTPGPWEWRHYGADCTALVGAPALESSVPQPVNLSSGHPDARLIAAAPDGLDFADAFLAYIDRSDLDDLDFGRGLRASGLIEQARAFATKARGEG